MQAGLTPAVAEQLRATMTSKKKGNQKGVQLTSLVAATKPRMVVIGRNSHEALDALREANKN